ERALLANSLAFSEPGQRQKASRAELAPTLGYPPHYSGKSRGTSATLTIITSRVKGTPMRTKSPKRYWPGPSTRVFTGEEIGVMNAAEAARATVMAKGRGDTSSACAVAMATGAISTAVAVLEMNRPI